MLQEFINYLSTCSVLVLIIYYILFIFITFFLNSLADKYNCTDYDYKQAFTLRALLCTLLAPFMFVLSMFKVLGLIVNYIHFKI